MGVWEELALPSSGTQVSSWRWGTWRWQRDSPVCDQWRLLEEADLDDLERGRRTCVRRKNGEDFRMRIRMGTEPSTHPSTDGTFMNSYSNHGQLEGCGLRPGGAGEPWANYEQGRSRVSSGAI